MSHLVDNGAAVSVLSDPVAPSAPERWQTIFDGDRARVAIIGPAGQFVAVNRAWRARHGDLHDGTPWTEHNCFDVLIGEGSAASLSIAEAISEILDGACELFEPDRNTLASGPTEHSSLRAYAWIQHGERWAIVRFDDAI
jgi:hypothetical protein